jgi:phosphoenolpyruvate carboxykinase (ATP)
VPVRQESVFGLDVPQHVPGSVPDDVLDPRRTWNDAASYDTQAARLAGMFRKNFEQFAERVHGAVREAGPKL